MIHAHRDRPRIGAPGQGAAPLDEHVFDVMGRCQHDGCAFVVRPAAARRSENVPGGSAVSRSRINREVSRKQLECFRRAAVPGKRSENRVGDDDVRRARAEAPSPDDASSSLFKRNIVYTFAIL